MPVRLSTNCQPIILPSVRRRGSRVEIDAFLKLFVGSVQLKLGFFSTKIELSCDGLSNDLLSPDLNVSAELSNENNAQIVNTYEKILKNYKIFI